MQVYNEQTPISINRFKSEILNIAPQVESVESIVENGVTSGRSIGRIGDIILMIVVSGNNARAGFYHPGHSEMDCIYQYTLC